MTDHTTTDSGSEDSGPEDCGAAQGPCAIAVELHFDESSNVLSARLSECDAADPLDLDGLQGMLEEGGFAEYNFQPGALEGVLRRVQQRETGEYPIAERLDADICLGATADQLQVLLTTSRAYGGEPVTEERLLQSMAEAGFDQGGILPSALKRALLGDPVENLVLAQGSAPRSGQDSRIELLVDFGCEATGPKDAGGGRVDHYSVRNFVIVEPGRRLMRRHPPTQGVAGCDVYGKPIKASDGRDLPLPRDMPGVVPDPEDSGLFLAEYKGHPVAFPGGIRVDKTLVLDYVDLRTGNIDFDGSVLVKGDVAAGVTVKASGDIVIKGTAERAFLHAGSDLQVDQGIIGSESAAQGGKHDVLAEAERAVQCGFASGVCIRAGGDLVVREYLNHCDALALGRVLVGQTGGHGVIVGGCCHGCRGVAARASGTPAGVATRIRAGLHDELSEAQRKVLEEQNALRDRLAQLREMLTSMARPDAAESDEHVHLKEKIQRTLDDYERRFAESNLRLDGLDHDLTDASEAIIECTERVFPGSVIEIGAATLAIKTEASGGRFLERQGEVVRD